MAEAFAEDELGLREIEGGVEVGAGGVLDGVLGPEGLDGAGRAVGSGDGLERFFVGVGGGEGDVTDGMPVLGEDDVLELFADGVDDGDDSVAVLYRQGSARGEVVLNVDDEEGIVGLGCDGHGVFIVLLSLGWVAMETYLF